MGGVVERLNGGRAAAVEGCSGGGRGVEGCSGGRVVAVSGD